MSFAVSGMVPGERLASLVIMEPSDVFTTTEVILGTITVPILKGHVYRVGFCGSFDSTVNGDRILVALTYIDPTDLDSTSNIIQQTNLTITAANLAAGYPVYLEAEHEATWTGEIQFNVTGDRIAGTGDCELQAREARRAALFAEYAYKAA